MKKDVWLEHFDKIINVLLMNPSVQWQYWFTAVAGFLMFAWVFTRVGERMDVSNVDGFSGFIASAVGVSALLACMTAASIYVAPALRMDVNLLFLLVVAVVGSIVVAVPVIKFWTQAKFVNAVVAWMIALFASIVIITSFGYGFGSFESGKGTVQQGERHKALKEVMDGK